MNVISLLSWIGLILTATEVPTAPEPSDVEEGVAVTNILRIDQSCTLFCDIEDFPAIIGMNMPVKINGLITADATEFNEKIRTFLSDLLLNPSEAPKQVNLKNIRRGETFCFVADIEIDGRDLCDLLVANGLARRIIQVKVPQTKSVNNVRQTTQAASGPTQRYPYLASKTSKIFHRSDCQHASRIDSARILYFSNRLEAIRTGRQPCKTCNP